jgi:peptidyl-tRNA hydrolase, PTH1 family
MKVIIGLGNPGEEYRNTRHNAGIDLVEEMYNVQCKMYKDEYGWRRHKDIFVAEFSDLILVKTAGYFMNESGRMINDLKYNVKFTNKDLWVAHDDLDLRLGEYKIQMGKGPKVHNGVNSVETVLGTKEFGRIRIGIDNRTTPVDGEAYVLQKFNVEEKKVLDEVLEKVCDEIFKATD